MIVSELCKMPEFTPVTPPETLNKEISGVYVCDLLSWVMSHAKKGDVWITVHTHMNIAAVALLTEAACIIIPEGIDTEESTVKKATDEDIAILRSNLSAYEICSVLSKIV